MLLGIDVGTTHCKVGVFQLDGTAQRIVTRPMVAHRTGDGYAYFDPEEMWGIAAGLIRDVIEGLAAGAVAAVGIASMAETGLLVERRTGAARSTLVPWFDHAAQPQADFIAAHSDPVERFRSTGIRASFKASLAKILWLRDRDPDSVRDAVWLSAADYIAFRLTGRMGTDYSLATRTYAFRLDTRAWDTGWIESFGLPAALFPPAHLSGTAVGTVTREIEGVTGLATETPVAVAGHDHVCAALALGAIRPGVVLNSMGTAEALVGALPPRALGEKEFYSGLVYGCHAVRGRDYWMGGLSASGRSVEWLRGILGDPPLVYEDLERLLDQTGQGPGEVLYFPYLLGNQSRAPDANARAAFIGLSDAHGRADLLRAVLEGTAYEMETIRRIAVQVNGIEIHRLVAGGGGTRNRRWMQIKADVSDCRIDLSPVSEATLLGAAISAGIGSHLYADAAQAVAAVARPSVETFLPDPERHARYADRYEQDYVTFQKVINQKRTKT